MCVCFLSLSRACLGKTIIYIYINGAKNTVRTRVFQLVDEEQRTKDTVPHHLVPLQMRNNNRAVF